MTGKPRRIFTIVYTDAGFVWALPAFGFLFVALLRLAIALWRRRAAL